MRLPTFDMTTYNQIRDTAIWDSVYDLPVSKDTGNPWIYTAYTDLLLSCHGECVSRESVQRYYLECLVEPPKKGLFHRFPGGFGGLISHDELMGAAYLSKEIAQDILDYLTRNDGEFSNNGEPNYVVRHVFLLPFLKSCAGYKVGLVSQILVSAHIFFRISSKDDFGGKLKIWLIGNAMKNQALVNFSYFVWKMFQKVSLKWCLSQEISKFEIYQKIAPEKFY